LLNRSRNLKLSWLVRRADISSLALLLGLCAHCNFAEAIDNKRIIVLSAASAAPAVQDLAARFKDRTGTDIRVSIASSGTLARQIRMGAPADLYISASTRWIDQLIADGFLDRARTLPLARNRLVFIRPSETSNTPLINLSKPFDVANQLNGGRLAIGDPAHVPAGTYAQNALQNLGLWPAVRGQLARQSNVRGVLAMVERGETPLGIVYATDAALSNGVRLAAIIPASAHNPIVYSAAVLSVSTNPQATIFFHELTSSNGLDVFEHYGFAVTRPESKALTSKTLPSRP
jgi:molybdate transport system substrate-binding protein